MNTSNAQQPPTDNSGATSTTALSTTTSNEGGSGERPIPNETRLTPAKRPCPSALSSLTTKVKRVHGDMSETGEPAVALGRRRATSPPGNPPQAQRRRLILRVIDQSEERPTTAASMEVLSSILPLSAAQFPARQMHASTSELGLQPTSSPQLLPMIAPHVHGRTCIPTAAPSALDIPPHLSTLRDVQGEEGDDSEIARHLASSSQPSDLSSSSSSSSSSSLTTSTSTIGTTTMRRTSTPKLLSMSPLPSTYTCPLCLSLLVRPVTLECGSSLCESCAAQALHHAWAIDGKRTAPCPVLGRRCIPLTRLPRLNVLLHNNLLELYPQQYQARMSEVSASPHSEVVAAVQARTAKLVRLSRERQQGGGGRRRIPPALQLRGGGGGSGGGRERGGVGANGQRQQQWDRHWFFGLVQQGEDEDEVEIEDEEELQGHRNVLDFLAHLRFSIPFILALLSLLHVPARGAYSSLATNGFALLLTSCVGSHWALWSLLSSMLTANTVTNTAADACAAALETELVGFRHLPQDLMLRVKLAGDLAPGLGFCCTWMLLSNAVDLLTTWGRLLMMRAAIRQQQRQRGGSREVESDLRESVWWLIATELLILIGAWLWYELLSLASYRAFHFILEQGGGTSGLKVFANPRMHNLCCVTWYLGIFTRIVLGPLLPPQDLEKQVVILRGLQGLPTWRAIVLDPRITLLHLHS